jgi:hypothetical protein
MTDTGQVVAEALATVYGLRGYRTVYGTYKVELHNLTPGFRGRNLVTRFETTNKVKAAGVLEYLSAQYAVTPYNELGTHVVH